MLIFHKDPEDGWVVTSVATGVDPEQEARRILPEGTQFYLVPVDEYTDDALFPNGVSDPLSTEALQSAIDAFVSNYAAKTV